VATVFIETQQSARIERSICRHSEAKRRAIIMRPTSSCCSVALLLLVIVAMVMASSPHHRSSWLATAHYKRRPSPWFIPHLFLHRYMNTGRLGGSFPLHNRPQGKTPPYDDTATSDVSLQNTVRSQSHSHHHLQLHTFCVASTRWAKSKPGPIRSIQSNVLKSAN